MPLKPHDKRRRQLRKATSPAARSWRRASAGPAPGLPVSIPSQQGHEHARPRPPGAAGLRVTASWLFRVGPRPATLQHTWHRVRTATAVVFRTQMLKHIKGQSSRLIFTVCSENFPNSKASRPPPPPPPTPLREPATHKASAPSAQRLAPILPLGEHTGTGIPVTVGGDSPNQANEVTRHTAHRHARYLHTRIHVTISERKPPLHSGPHNKTTTGNR